MNLFGNLKKAVGVAAMTNPVTAFAWQGYKLADSKRAAKRAPQDVTTMPVSDEQEAATLAGGPEAEAYLRGRIDDDDLMPVYRTPAKRPASRREEHPDDLQRPAWKGQAKQRTENSDSLMGFACSVLSVSPPPPPADMNNLAPGSVISNDVFRALVWRNAQKVSRGKRPDARVIAAVQGAVLKFLRLKSIKIALPGAAPGRRTV